MYVQTQTNKMAIDRRLHFIAVAIAIEIWDGGLKTRIEVIHSFNHNLMGDKSGS